MPRPNFKTLVSGYPRERLHKACPDVASVQHHCALRLSIALEAAGSPIAKAAYNGNLCEHGYGRGASDLAAYLKTRWGVDQGFEHPGRMPDSLRGKSGVILFENIPGFEGQGHIDVFSDGVGRTGTYWSAKIIWFWSLA